MTDKEHAKIWRTAARVVASLDPRVNFASPGWSRSYSAEEVATWGAYSTAAVVLNAIATEYERAGDAPKSRHDDPRGKRLTT